MALDANGDGTLDASEIQRAPAALRTLDANADGRLTAEEYRPRPRRSEATGGVRVLPDGPEGGRGVRPQPPLIGALRQLDRSADGQLQADEYRPMRPAGGPPGPDGADGRGPRAQDSGTSRRPPAAGVPAGQAPAAAAPERGPARQGGGLEITGVTAASDPFRLLVAGREFVSGCRVRIGGAAAPAPVFKGGGLIAVSGANLEKLVPRGQPVEVVVINPDGRQSPAFAFTR
jgi:hypothetical protein